MEEKKEEKKPTLIETIAGSGIFVALCTKNYLRELHNRNTRVAIQVKIAKKLNKPVVIILTNKLSKADKVDLERFFIGYNVMQVLELNPDDEKSWEAVVKEIGKLAKEVQRNRVLTRPDFIRIDMDKEHYYYSFKIDAVEVCLEPCAGGFCVAAYDEDKTMLESRKCTNCDGYLDSYQALFGERRDDAWTKALVIANELYKRHVVISTQIVTGDDVKEKETSG